MRPVVIGTRASALSRCQTELVRQQLAQRFPERTFELKLLTAQADRNPELPLTAMSGEGVFVKELEAALVAGEVDLAVHSLKDLPTQISDGLTLAAITRREDPRDALVSRSGASLTELPDGARVGTSSLRRRSQLQHARRGLAMLDIRGNVDTRLRKLDEGRYDAIVLAACGLIRLGLDGQITQYLEPEVMLPEPGQGAVAIEARARDAELVRMLAQLDDADTRACVEAERAFLRCLGGGCRVPIAALGRIEAGGLRLDGAVLDPDGSRRLGGRQAGRPNEADVVGQRLAREMLAQGAADLLKSHE